MVRGDIWHAWGVVLLSLVLLVGSPVVQAVEFAGGTGTGDDPYQIATAEQLISIGTDPNLLDKHFAMVSDIDLDPNLSSEYAFYRVLIGGSFTGVFDGNGFRIQHLTMTEDAQETDRPELAMFARIASGAKVTRVVLEDAHILSTSFASTIGSLCISNSGIVSRCSANGIITGMNIGAGLVPWNYGTVEECSSSCIVVATTTGGLVAHNKGGQVRNSCASGQVTGGTAGGLAAINYYGLIWHSYAACHVDGSGSSVGGLVGSQYPRDDMIGLCYFLDPCDGGGPNNGVGVSLTDIQMRQRASFVEWDFWDVNSDGTRVAWLMPENGYPALAWPVLRTVPYVRGLSLEIARVLIEEAEFRVGRVAYDYDSAIQADCVITTHAYGAAPVGTTLDIVLSLGPYAWSLNSGRGEAVDPYTVESAGQIDDLADHPELWDRHFRLTADIVLTGRTYGRSLIGASDGREPGFGGTFDGAGHVIKGLTIRSDPAHAFPPWRLGLFGETARSARIKDLGVTDVLVEGAGEMEETGGMLCALNQGYVGRCYSRGTIRGRGKFAGLVGVNEGLIENCHTGGRIEAGSASGSEGVYAGLVAQNAVGRTISTCYATCAIPTGYGAGLVGVNQGFVERCLWDVQVSGTTGSAGGLGLRTWELMDVDTLRSKGWGGNPSWVVDDGRDYPRLVWEGTPGMAIP
jgi:hypothetical protein